MNKTVLDACWLNYYRNYGRSIQQLAPFFMTGHEKFLNRHETDGFYKILSKVVRITANKHFKFNQAKLHEVKPEQAEEFHVERVLLLYELFQCRSWPEYTPQTIMVDFERAFPYYEALLQCRRVGIALPSDRTPYQLKVHWVVTMFIDIAIHARKGGDMYDFYVERYNTEPSMKVFARYQARYQAVQLMVGSTMSTYKLSGFSRPKE